MTAATRMTVAGRRLAGGRPRLVDRHPAHLPISDHKQVKPAFGQLCIREVTPGVVSRALAAIAKSSGPGRGQDGAGVPVGHVRAGDRGRRHHGEPGAGLERQDQRQQARAAGTDRGGDVPAARAVPVQRPRERRARPARPRRLDARHRLPDRRGAGPALRDQRRRQADSRSRRQDVGGERHRGARARRGLAIQPRPKTTAGWRVIALPDVAVRMVRRRLASSRTGRRTPSWSSRRL